MQFIKESLNYMYLKEKSMFLKRLTFKVLLFFIGIGRFVNWSYST